jgi:DNA primase
MPGIDFQRLRAEVTMEQVLSLLGFEPTHRRGDQWYGACPLHESSGHRPRSFSANVANGCYYCQKCRSSGNHLKLWAQATKLPIHPAAILLCQQLGKEVPWIQAQRSSRSNPWNNRKSEQREDCHGEILLRVLARSSSELPYRRF